jgi:uncharacterized protein DUF6221
VTRTPEQLAKEIAEEEVAEAVRYARLLKWLRREVNRDLRAWRGLLKASDAGPFAEHLPGLVADAKAKLRMITWAESWQGVWTNEFYGPDMRWVMVDYLRYIMYGIRKMSVGYAEREGYREEWRS